MLAPWHCNTDIVATQAQSKRTLFPTYKLGLNVMKPPSSENLKIKPAASTSVPRQQRGHLKAISD